MATDFAVWVVRSAVAKLAALLEQEHGLLEPGRSDIAFLSAELSAMDTALARLTDRSQVLDVEARLWRRHLRELAYDVEDTIDAVVDRPDNGGRFGRLIANALKLCKKRDLASRIGKLKARAINLSRGCKVDAADVNLPVVPVNPPHHDICEDLMDRGLVGIDGPRDKVIELLLRKEPEVAHLLKAVSIVGPGGLGKTTLARVLYSSIKSQFDCSAFVSVSRIYDAPDVLNGIRSQIEQPMDGNSEEMALVNHIRQFLELKRYLIVLDDLWCTSSWEIIRAALPENNRGSRIIITTRIESVARSCCSNWDDHTFVMPTLSDSHSETLFYRKAIGCEDSCPPEGKQVLEEILKKCGGVPLAIIITASLLARRCDKMNDWETVQNIICCAPKRSTDDEPTERILATSYYFLPHHLKPCLFHLTSFPEGYEIMKEDLVWQWIAEGFIWEKDRESLWQTGETYFNELISRRLIEPADISYDGTVKTCHVHGMVLDLIKFLAYEENFWTVLHTAGATCMPDKIRRVTLSNSKEDMFDFDLSHVRSLSVPRLIKHTALLKNLRVLVIRGGNNSSHTRESDLGCITKLYHLKYLGLCHMAIKNLPAHLERLQNLETLEVRKTLVKKLPKSLLKLKYLRFLHVDSVTLPEKIGNTLELDRLGELDILRSPLGAVQGLGNLLKLRKLLIHWSPDLSCIDTDKYGETLVHSLSKLTLLQSLDIHGISYNSPKLGSFHNNLEFLDDWSPTPHLQRFDVGGGCYLPRASKWMALQANLTHISIIMSEVRMEDLQLLGGIPMLCQLHLSSNQANTRQLIIQSDHFPSLKWFSFGCPWVYLTFEQLAMPKLLFLSLPIHVLTAEPNGFSFGIEHLMSLKKVDVKVNGEGADASKIKAAKMAIKKAANRHPKLEISWHEYVREGKGLDAAADFVEYLSKEEEVFDSTVDMMEHMSREEEVLDSTMDMMEQGGRGMRQC